MKTVVSFVRLSAVLATTLLGQAPASASAQQSVEVKITSAVAEKLLIHKADPDACPHIAMAAHVTGTVVVIFDISKSGDILHPRVFSGPAMLRKPVLDAVRKYKYKPYILNGKPVEAETTVSVHVDQMRYCPDN
jgi:protein TonB